MSTINERFREVRELLKLSQDDFATMANRTRSEIKNIEYNKTTPKDEVIKAVCSAHGCNEIWLRTGEGEPFQEATREEEILRFAAQTAKGSDEFRKAFVSMLAKLDSEDWNNLAALFRKLSAETKKE